MDFFLIDQKMKEREEEEIDDVGMMVKSDTGSNLKGELID